MRIAVGISALIAMSWIAPPVQALELFGFRLWGEEKVVREEGTFAYSLSISVPDVRNGLLEKLEGASLLVGDQDQPILNSAGLLSRANGDYRRLLAELYAEGYYSGQISIKVNGREASSYLLTQTLPMDSHVEIEIIAGERFTFGTLDIAPIPDRLELSDTFQVGAVAKAQTILDVADDVIEAWRQQGHALAQVVGRDVVADHRDDRLDVQIRIDPGPVLSYGPVSVTGTKRVDPEFVRYMTGLQPGGQFDPDDLERARERLVGLGVFQSVVITEGQTALPGDQIDIGFDVAEMPRRRFGIGLTLSNLDGLGASAYWLHRNLFGRAESFRLDLSVDKIGVENGFDRYDYAIGAAFLKPGVITPDTAFFANGEIRHYVFESIRSREADVAIGLQHQIEDLQLSGAIFAAYNDIEDDLGLRRFRLVGLELGAIWDNRDNPFNPARGFYAELDLIPFAELVYENAGVHASAEFRGYQVLDANETFRIAERVRIGTLIGVSANQAPADMLFFAGGSETVRGYDFQSIGIDNGGNFTGGLSTLSLGVEFRAAISDSFGAVAFFDAANVSSDPWPPAGQWFRGIGVGLRYNTGFGPLRVDIARGLDLRPGDPNYAIYVGLGQAF